MKCECCRREVVADDLYTLQIEAAERPTFELTVCRACLAFQQRLESKYLSEVVSFCTFPHRITGARSTISGDGAVVRSICLRMTRYGGMGITTGQSPFSLGHFFERFR